MLSILCADQKTILKSWFSLSTMWVLGLELRPLWLAPSRVILSFLLYFLNQAGDPPGSNTQFICFCFGDKSQAAQPSFKLSK